MGRLNGLPSFGLVLACVLLALRLLHVGVPIAYPPAGPGPFEVDSAERAAELAGFPVWMPSYRPQRAGPAPRIVVSRLGAPRVDVSWSGRRFLRLSQSIGGRHERPPAAAPRSATDSGDLIWREGRTWRALARRGPVSVSAETDLSRRDLERVLHTLRETRRLRPRRSG